MYQRRDFLSVRGGRDGRGGRGGRGGGRGGHTRGNDRAASNTDDNRNVSAAAISTEIVEYNASNSTIASQSPSDRGARSGGHFGPRRTD
jgi:hypothetical protein